MHELFLWTAAGTGALLLPYLWRALTGPTVFDRLLGINGIGSRVPLLIVLVGLLYGRSELFVDIAIGLFLLNPVTTLLVAHFVRLKRWRHP